jgi:hypothetical protein
MLAVAQQRESPSGSMGFARRCARPAPIRIASEPSGGCLASRRGELSASQPPRAPIPTPRTRPHHSSRAGAAARLYLPRDGVSGGGAWRCGAGTPSPRSNSGASARLVHSASRMGERRDRCCCEGRHSVSMRPMHAAQKASALNVSYRLYPNFSRTKRN